MSTTASNSANINPYNWTGVTVTSPAQQMTSTGYWPTLGPQPVPAPWVVTDMALNESGIVLDAGFQKILVPKGHLKRLLTLIHMAELCELVGVDDDAQ